MATPDWNAPCTGKYASHRQGKHSLQRAARGPKKRGFCRECGAREPDHVNGEELFRLETAVVAFRDASDVLEPLLVNGDKDERLSAIIAWRAALTKLRQAEAIGG